MLSKTVRSTAAKQVIQQKCGFFCTVGQSVKRLSRDATATNFSFALVDSSLDVSAPRVANDIDLQGSSWANSCMASRTPSPPLLHVLCPL